MPASSAASSTRRACSSDDVTPCMNVRESPKVIAPRHRRDTMRPARPRVRRSIVCYTNVLMSIVVAILALALLIVVHEGGHYLVAKWSGMRVERFSVGFGPALMTWKHKGTKFQLAPIPLGGFVQITGMNPHEEYDESDPNVYPNRPATLRFLTIFAGPATNVIFSSVLVFFVFSFAGAQRPTGNTLIASVTKDWPA